MRSCEECKKYVYDAGGQVKNPEGQLVERPVGLPVNCTGCIKFDAGTKQAWNGFTANAYYWFRTYLACRAFKVLPREGGTDMQDPKMLDILLMLDIMFEKNAEMDSKEFQVKLAVAKRGL